MPVYIQHISTAVPEHFYTQEFLRDRMKESISEKRSTQSIIHRIYTNSGIKKRHSVVNDFNMNGHKRFFFQKDGSLLSPSTGKRNDLYAKYAKTLFVQIARQLLDGYPSISKDQITHVITVSCTGFFAPEPAYEIVKELGLPSSTQRFHLGFMGCFAAFPALKMAKSFSEANSDAVVMVVCLELCSLHFQASEQTDQLISSSVFADGGAGALVSARKPDNSGYRLDQFATSIAKKSEQDMAWTIGDTGFDMVLSTYVPEIIGSNLKTAIQPLLETYDITTDQISHWAIHPGGRAIIDKVEQNLNLKSDQLHSSRSVLADYGNMSSATILFVLNHLLNEPSASEAEAVLSMAFGPGLTIESGILTKITT